MLLREAILPSNPFNCLPSPLEAYKFPEAASLRTRDRYTTLQADILPVQILRPFGLIDLKAAIFLAQR